MKQTLASVRAGATFLDKKFPGWEKRIDPTILELSSEKSCILGQLYGDFNKGVIKLGPRYVADGDPSDGYVSEKGGKWAEVRGFDTDEGWVVAGAPSYEALNCAWMYEIAKRLSPKAKKSA